MRIINRKLVVGFGFLCISSSLSAETFNQSLVCSYENTSGIEKVVVFVNGIRNEISKAERSRMILSEQLGDICSSEDCIVQKFYNKADGAFDDINELSFVAGLEEYAAGSAFKTLAVRFRYDYRQYKEALEQNGILKAEAYLENDENVWKELRRLAFSSQGEIEFIQSGSLFAEWLIDKLMLSEDIDSTYNSLYLTLMRSKADFYNNLFKTSYTSVLTENYFNNRDFYSRDSNAEKAITRTVEGLVTYLEEHLLSGKKVVVVAHSQGNHIIELAHGVLVEKWGVEAMQAIQVVGVASVASTTPNDTYLTWDSDNIVLRNYDGFIGLGGDPLAPNFIATNDVAVEDTNGHGFNDVYMNENFLGRYDPRGQGNIAAIQDMLNDTDTEYPISDWIVGLVKDSMEVAFPYTSDITSTGFISISLRWEQYNDMDLWVFEDDGTAVYFRNLSGIYGQLDRDDVDGDGPEHYTADIECTSAAEKTWNVGIQQYPSGGAPAIAHLSIKLGNTVLKQKSYAVSEWPSEIVGVAEITFGSLVLSNVLPYTITIRDEI